MDKATENLARIFKQYEKDKAELEDKYKTEKLKK